MTLAGQAQLRGPGRSGSAERAVQVADKNTWVLTGDSRASAVVEQDGSKVSAPRIEIDDRTRLIRAEGGGVRAVLAPAKGERANATLVGDPSKPTFGKAERMVFDQSARTATLSGGAALWQGASSLFGRDITLNDSERSVVATGQARAVLAPDAAAKRPEQRAPTVLLASRLIYREGPKSGDAPPSGEISLDGDVSALQGARRANASAGTRDPRSGPSRPEGGPHGRRSPDGRRGGAHGRGGARDGLPDRGPDDSRGKSGARDRPGRQPRGRRDLDDHRAGA